LVTIIDFLLSFRVSLDAALAPLAANIAAQHDSHILGPIAREPRLRQARRRREARFQFEQEASKRDGLSVRCKKRTAALRHGDDSRTTTAAHSIL